MLGFLMAALAGAAMSVQGVMNTRLSEKIGLLESNAGTVKSYAQIQQRHL